LQNAIVSGHNNGIMLIRCRHAHQQQLKVFESFLLTTSHSNVKAVTSDHSTQKECRLHDVWLNSFAWTDRQTGDSQVSDQHVFESAQCVTLNVRLHQASNVSKQQLTRNLSTKSRQKARATAVVIGM